jgi:hypothetical protein
MVDVERGRNNTCVLRRAASVNLSEAVLKPSFENQNILDQRELAESLNDLAASSGLLRQKRWSVSLPESATRSVIFTMENQPGSQSEFEEMVGWKIERNFGVPLDELSVSRERLPKDSQGKDRYIAVGIKLSVLNEYESLFESLGWRAGMILPRHFGEAQWLVKNGSAGDSLLVSSSDEGFTAVVFRAKDPLILRVVDCDRSECEDELYRLLMFYRDRRASDDAANPASLSRLLVIGSGFTKQRAGEIVNETLGGNLRAMDPADLGLQLPGGQLSFDTIAAPAGLATLSWQ